ncbi:MAG: dienelactone hydrolase family protein [Deltaproteobacteria bacterium]|nr:MAG: dienelactone hydrolase family protein [Deltaproteobacteria bacterium]
MKIAWETVTIDQSPMGLYLCQPEGTGPFPAIIVGQNQDGVAAFTQEMTRRIAEAGYIGIAPQFYHREGEPKTPEDTANIKNTRRDVNVINDIHATINFLKGCATADTSRLGVVGFCMGGRIAFLAAAACDVFKATVDFYGGGTYQQWGDRPAPAMLAAQVSCPVQGHFGDLDKNPPPDEMRRLGAELTKLGKPHEFFYYADAQHGFNRSGWKGYRPEADATSWARTLEFFAKHLGGATTSKVAAAG